MQAGESVMRHWKQLLTLEDSAEAEDIAARLDELNRERQAMEAEMLMEAEAEVIAEYGTGENASVIVTARQNWHPGIVGLLAARLKEKFKRPAFAIAFDASGRGSGSGRSIPGFDMGKMVRGCRGGGALDQGRWSRHGCGSHCPERKSGQV